MFKRWVILLLVLFAASLIGYKYYYANFSDTFSYSSVDSECLRYLRTIDGNWTGDDDIYWERRCEQDNFLSDWSKEMRQREAAEAKLGLSVQTTVFSVIALILSFIGRWLVAGRLKWD